MRGLGTQSRAGSPYRVLKGNLTGDSGVGSVESVGQSAQQRDEDSDRAQIFSQNFSATTSENASLGEEATVPLPVCVIWYSRYSIVNSAVPKTRTLVSLSFDSG